MSHDSDDVRSRHGEQGWSETGEPIDNPDTASVSALLDRIGDARVVLLGESTHGTCEYARWRSREDLPETYPFGL
jgi:protein-L-isoaspartate(D-aspartate) O-methyltransferase